MSQHILVVDDSATMRDMLEFTLKNSGYQVDQANDGQVGLETARKGDYNMIITDLNMPNMSGFELIEALRQEQKYKSIPIMMLTTEKDETLKSKGKQIGATGWIEKPFHPDKLIQLTNRLCPN